jgi:CRP-like cAMP-binding protein/Fe-S-cluster-containing hydrogenase component 2
MNLGQTRLKRLEQYKDRWTSYGGNTGIIELSEKPTPEVLKRYGIFKDYDDRFLEKLSPDVSIARWKSGTVLFEEGSYIDLAFFVVSGSVHVYLQKQHSAPPPIFGRSSSQIISASLVGQGSHPSAGQARPPGGGQTMLQAQVEKQKTSASSIMFLASMDFNLPAGGAMKLGAGEIFGEIGALNGWPQSATAKTASECQLLQIRTAALRIMRKRSTTLKAHLDKLYKERSLMSQLQATPLFREMGESTIHTLAQKVELVSCEPDEVITKEGEPADAVYVVRSGFIRLSQRLGEGNIIVSYLSKGSLFGDAELLLGGTHGWLHTASSKEYSELIKISRDDFQNLLAKKTKLEKVLWETVVSRVKETGYSRKNINQSEFISTALNKGLVEGNSILVIDLNVCTRCDDCVRGCKDTHAGIPRFVREGDKVGNLLITRACYHCQDPVCLVGCPTGAIRRTDVGDVVAIDDKLCIGCASCANNCPYDAITMHDTGDPWPADMIPEGLRGKDKQLATKCDLCFTDPAGPACVRSCPHGCAIRVGDLQEFRSLLWKEAV